MFGLFQSVKVPSMKAGEFQTTYNPKTDVILDVRTANEYQSGHLKGAKNVDYFTGSFSPVPSNWNKDKRYFVYCASGGRSYKAAKAMIQAGFDEVYNIGGYGALKGVKLK